MTSGPTQNYDRTDAAGWRPRPVLAGLVRATASFGPVLFALAVGAAAAHWVPASRTPLPATAWLLLVVALSSVVLVLLSHVLRRLVPLSALLRLSLVLPDRVPSRFAVARRTWSPARLQRAGGTEDEPVEWLLALVGTLSEHDARTRAHGERVQAYAALIGAELGLSREDVDRLSWVALLHDVGKVHVPVEVINKKGLPDDQEWATLQEHPAHGGRLVEPLRGWLGPWLDGVEQHHERFDGGGYPQGLHADEISLAARVIAVADTYDVITSARSYKKPLSAEQARAEITRCAGAQFDPEVVRAFLGIGVGRLRLIAGPATLLAALPGVGSVPAQAVSNVTAVAHTAGGQVLAAVLTAGVGVGAGLAATDTVTVVPAPVVAAADVVDVSGNSPTEDSRRSGGPTTSPSDVAAVQALSTEALATPSSAETLGRSVLSATGTPVLLAATGTPTATTPRPTGTPVTERAATAAPSATRTTVTPATPATTTAAPPPTSTDTPSAATAVPTVEPTQTPVTTTTPTTATPTSTTPTSTTPTSTTPTSTTPTSTTPTSSAPTATPSATASPTATSSCEAAGQGATRLEDKDLRGCDLQARILTGNWRGVKLGGANLTGASLLTLDLSHADLRTADLDLTKLVSVDLTHADLRGASFRGAVLTGVDLTHAKWDAHTFDGAVLIAVTGM